MSVEDDLVHLQLGDKVATITLDSPQNRNALSRRLVADLEDRLVAADAAAAVRVIVLTHTGGTFCAGADLKEAVEVGMEEGTRGLLRLLRLVVSLSTPVVGVVSGHVRAGGVGLVGACDVALVTDDSTFAFSEALLGLTPAIISLTTSSRLREREAAWKYLTGTTFSGVEAARTGLVTESVDRDQVPDRLREVLARFVAVAPQGLRETKALLNQPLLERIDRDGEALVALSARLFASDEAHEGMTAFREKRPPRWVDG